MTDLRINIKRRTSLRQWRLYALVLPGLVYMLINNYLPMAFLFIAFKKVNFALGFFKSPWVGLDNIKFLFQSPDIALITRNTLVYNAVFLALNTVLAVSVSIFLSEVRSKPLLKFYQTTLLMPYLISMVMVSYIVYALLATDTGVLNKSILQPLSVRHGILMRFCIEHDYPKSRSGQRAILICGGKDCEKNLAFIPCALMLHIIMLLFSLACILPFVLLAVASVTDERSIAMYGYSLVPRQLSVSAYSYVWNSRTSILRAYGMTFLTTIVGTSTSLMITSALAYPLSRIDFRARKTLSFLVFFTLLFNGGLVPTYLVYTNILQIKNTLLGQLLPALLLNGFNVLIMRTYFATSIPFAVIESASLDGANDFQVYFRLILPLSLPIMATVGLLVGIGYWNDWFNGLIYITNSKLYTIQNLLNRIISDIQFLTTMGADSNSAAAFAAIPTASVRMALAVIGIAPIFAAYPFFQKYFIKGIAVGAVKG